MENTPAILKIVVSLTNGNSLEFSQSDLLETNRILESITPSRVFTQHHLIISGPKSTHLIPCSTIAQLDLHTSPIPGWPHSNGVRRIVKITAEQFKERYDPDRYAMLLPGDRTHVFAEVELANGVRHILELSTLFEQRLAQDVAVFIQQLLTSGAIHFETDTGISLINTANAARITLTPGFEYLPAATWMASFLG